MRVLKIKFCDTEKAAILKLPDDLQDGFACGDMIVVSTDRGKELARVLSAYDVGDNFFDSLGISENKLPGYVRKATDGDIEVFEENKQFSKDALKVCDDMIKSLQLPMKLAEVYSTFERERIIFYFTAEGRVDFRQLVRKLASHFKTRIELRQIGVRDEIKMLGSVGICGRECCCKVFIECFYPISLNMARFQGLPASPSKLSGACGRLMCCLKYEEKLYSVKEFLPQIGEKLETPQGKGVLLDVDVINGKVKVELASGVRQNFNISDFVSEDRLKEYVSELSCAGDDRFDCFVRTEGETEEDLQEQPQ